MTLVYVLTDNDGFVIGYGSHRSMDEEVEVKLVDDSFIQDVGFGYRLVDGELIKDDGKILELAKIDKINQLDLSCKDDILSGFEHTLNGQVYWFSYDMEAQGNFRDGREALKDGMVDSLPWTVREGGRDGAYSRVEVNLDTILELSVTAMVHKTEKISKYRDVLIPRVEKALTIEEVNEINW